MIQNEFGQSVIVEFVHVNLGDGAVCKICESIESERVCGLAKTRCLRRFDEWTLLAFMAMVLNCFRVDRFAPAKQTAHTEPVPLPGLKPAG